MQIIFDHQIFSKQRHGGVSRYFTELLRQLPPSIWQTTTFLSSNEYIKFNNLFRTLGIPKKMHFKGEGRILSELNKPYSLYRLYKKNYDVFHQTDFDPYCLKAIGSKPMITTFHDTNFMNLDKNEERVKFQKRSLSRADKIIAISHNTKKDLIKHFNINDNKIKVIHHGVDILNVSNYKTRIIEPPFILYIGLRKTFKNFNRFIKAFSIIKKSFPEIKVVCTRAPFTKEELQLFYDLNIYNNLLFINADEITLARLYRDAELFVFPSLYEGFGMPILEAMSQNCPVVLSNTSSFPEIANDAGYYFDPYDEESIAESIKKVLSDTNLKSQLIEKGKQRVKSFTWKSCAQNHINVYKSVL